MQGFELSSQHNTSHGPLIITARWEGDRSRGQMGTRLWVVITTQHRSWVINSSHKNNHSFFRLMGSDNSPASQQLHNHYK